MTSRPLVERFTVTLHEPGDRFEPPLPGAAYLGSAPCLPPLGWPTDPRTGPRAIPKPCVAVTWVQSVSAQMRAAEAAFPPLPAEPLTDADRVIALDQHLKFGCLISGFMGAHPGRDSRDTSVSEVLIWSSRRLAESVQASAEAKAAAEAKPAAESEPKRSTVHVESNGADSKASLKCAEHISKGLFEWCRHWELSTGETLELRVKPSYSPHAFDLILWEADPKTPGQRVGDSTLADSAAQALDELSMAVGAKRHALPFDSTSEREVLLGSLREIARVRPEIAMFDQRVENHGE